LAGVNGIGAQDSSGAVIDAQEAMQPPFLSGTYLAT